MKPIAHLAPANAGYVERIDEGPLLRHLIRPHFSKGQERLLIFGFDDMGRLAGLTESEAGHARHAVLAPAMVRQAFAFADATRLVLAHNHPSDDYSPSRCDLDLTQRLAGAATLMGMVISDHVILTAMGHFSFRAAGLL